MVNTRRNNTHDITKREKVQSINFQKRITVQYLISQILASSDGEKADFEKILELVASAFDWDVGLFWVVNRKKEILSMRAGWSINEKKLQKFLVSSNKFKLDKNLSFVGRIWDSGKPKWDAKINTRKYFKRRKAALSAGLTSAFGFPVKVSGAVYGVLEFYTRNNRSYDENTTTKIVDSISFQLGQFINNKEAERSRQAAAQQLRVLFQSMPDGVTVENNNGEIVYSNQEAAKIFGLDTATKLQKVNIKDLFGKFLLTSRSGKTLTYRDLPAAQAFRHNKNFSLVINFKNKSTGKERWFNVKASLVENGGDDLLVVKVFHDVTKEVEEQKERELFLGLVSHEFRSPLASIKAYLQLIERRLIKKEYQELDGFVHSIDEQTDRLIKLINNWLDATRVTAGLLKLNKKEFDLDTLVENVIRDFQLVAKDNPIQRVGRTGIVLTADPDRVSQVLINLLSNAAKYSKKGQKIILKVHKTSEMIVASVQDFGPGIPQEKQKEIFQLYKRLSEKVPKGLGVGLYISAAIVKAHKGKIWYSGKEGQGATFTFSLPIRTH